MAAIEPQAACARNISNLAFTWYLPDIGSEQVGLPRGVAKRPAGDMQKLTDPTASFRLVLELCSGTVLVRGERVELPPREFRLLAKLAETPGEPIPPEDLVATVWPDVPDTPLQDLYPVISRLREFVGDRGNDDKLLRNRRQYGYYLDLEPHEVLVAETLPSEPIVIRLERDDEDVAPVAATGSAGTDSTEAPRGLAASPWVRTGLTAAAVVLLLASAWSAGFVLSRQRSQPPPAAAQPNEAAQPEATDNDDRDSHAERKRANRKGRDEKRRLDDKGRRAKKNRGRQLVAAGPIAPGPVPGPAAPPPAAAPAPQTERSDGGGGGGNNPPPRDEPAAKPQPTYPPPPAISLFHLYNKDSGDHVMTTSSSVASQKEAAGYAKTYVGKVYGATRQGLVGISLDGGSAYIFREASPKTQPACATAGLYRLTSGGDFFYTSSSSTASQWEAAGFTKTFVGYIGAC